MSDARPLREALDLINDLGKKPSNVFVLIRYLFLKYFGFPDLLLRLPQVIQHLCKSLLGPSSFQVFSFSSFEMYLRSYYSKLARNFRKFGRWGYVWDESLGFPMGPRFGSNWATYFIYGRLSSRLFSILSFLLFLVSVMSIGILSGEIFLSVVLCLLLLGSPAVIFSLVARRVKPEVIWWSLAIPLMVFALSNQWMYVWLIIGFLLLVNTSVSIILGAISTALFAWALLTGYTAWTSGILWLVPGALLRALRFLYAYWDGNLGATVKEQARVSIGRKSRGKILREFLLRLVEYTVRIMIPFMIAAWGQWEIGLVMSVVVIGVYLVNEYGFKVADGVSLEIITVCAVTSLILLSGSWLGLGGVLLVIFDHPFESAWQIAGRKQWETLQEDLKRLSPGISARNEYYAKLAQDYPWFSTLPFPDAQKLKDLFDAIPDYSRILLESDGDPREETKYIRFHDWAYHIFADRHIEFINQTFLNRMLEPALAGRYLNCLTLPKLSAEAIAMVCERLGARYFIAFSEETASALQSQGYCRVVEIGPKDYEAVSDMLYMPETPLILLEGPATTSIISPLVTWTQDSNRISWHAEAGKTHIVRYRYYPRFAAKQGDVHLKVVPFCPFEDLPLRFMSIQARYDGMLELKYR